MRLSAVPAIVFTCLTLVGCVSGSSPESLVAGLPSPEKTGSVVPASGPIPSGSVGTDEERASQTAQQREVLAWAGQVAQPPAFEAAPTAVALPVPSDRPLTSPQPEPPAIGSQAPVRSRVYGHRFRDAKPINFGRSSPRKLSVHGVDVSRWQGDIDWATLRDQGANFAYIKATDGGDHLDPMFMSNWRQAKEAGLKRGAYHFFYWCRTAGEQADWFIRNVPKEAGALPPVIDVEWNGESSCKPAPFARARPRKDAGLHGQTGTSLRPAADHLHRAGFLPRQPSRRIAQLSLLAALGGRPPVNRLSRPQMAVLAIFRLGNIRTASTAGSISTSSTATKTTGTTG